MSELAELRAVLTPTVRAGWPPFRVWQMRTRRIEIAPAVKASFALDFAQRRMLMGMVPLLPLPPKLSDMVRIVGI